jgi:DNA-directed RNA polymerase specialized sigma24 family protein
MGLEWRTPSAVTFEQLIAQQRPHVERVIQDLARRHYLAPAEIHEFREAVERALERNEYELLKAFDGRCTWETYLTTVITREFYLFQAALWGLWRPSAIALQLGAAAVLLEELVVRNRFGLNDAIDWMRTTHRVDLPRHRLLQLAGQLGIGDSAGRGRQPAAASLRPPDLNAALRDALALVSPDERLMLEFRYRDRLPLTKIAAVLRIEARTLQRRIETVKEVIRQSLLTQGIASDHVEALLASAESDANAHGRWWELALAPGTGEAGDR